MRDGLIGSLVLLESISLSSAGEEADTASLQSKVDRLWHRVYARLSMSSVAPNALLSDMYFAILRQLIQSTRKHLISQDRPLRTDISHVLLKRGFVMSAKNEKFPSHS